MNLELRELRCLVAIVDAGTFTDAGLDLGMSQAAVSRNLSSLETKLGARLLRRTTRRIEPTEAGVRALAIARRILAELDQLQRDADTAESVVRVGYSWSALGQHTIEFQNRWTEANPRITLELVRAHSPSAGLAEELVDFAILRRSPGAARSHGADAFEWQVVGTERRFCAVAAADPLAKRRTVTLADIADRPVAIDTHTGSTTLQLWPGIHRPTNDIDDWLNVIAAGRAVGITSEATVHQYRRPGVAYRAVRDAPPIDVRLAWRRGDNRPESASLLAIMRDLYGV
ncbi:MAG: LysR family transcriptional regulator [Glaciihabitans sp.]|nr:LysR family transcriptional regulator [Glaciihabitans sp.]